LFAVRGCSVTADRIRSGRSFADHGLRKNRKTGRYPFDPFDLLSIVCART